MDIKGYFDNIPHEPLMQLVRERIADGKVLDLIEAFLKQKIEEKGIITEPERGSPQGGIICQQFWEEEWLAVSAALRLPPAG